MKVLERQLAYSPFLERLRSAASRVLLLDYDGTLAPFSVKSQRVILTLAAPLINTPL